LTEKSVIKQNRIKCVKCKQEFEVVDNEFKLNNFIKKQLDDHVYLSDEEFSAYLHCADYFIYPCRDINNSGSLNAALTANLPVIVPDMPELNWVLPECKVVMQKKSEATLDFNECFGRISNMSPDTYQNLKNGTERWKSERSWKRVSEKYMALYRGLLDG
jgi:glycosyltransferase involved in cell wall biosynthesis